MIESLKFVLKTTTTVSWKQHVTKFDDHIYPQLLGTAIGTKCASSYACLTVGYLEETKPFTKELQKYFNVSECKLIMEPLQRYTKDFFGIKVKPF